MKFTVIAMTTLLAGMVAFSSPAQAQARVLNCEGLLASLDLSQAIEMVSLEALGEGQRAVGLIEVGNEKVPVSRDALDIIEFSEAGKSRPLEHEFNAEPPLSTDAGKEFLLFRCALFKAKLEGALELGIGEVGGHATRNTARILVIDAETQDLASQERRWKIWEGNNYNIAVNVDSSRRTSRTAGGFVEDWISFDHTNFGNIPLWGKPKLNPDNALFFPYSEHVLRLSETLSVTPARAITERLPLMILCQPLSCADFVAHFQDKQPDDTGATPTDVVEAEVVEDQTGNDTQVSDEAEVPTDDVITQEVLPPALICPEVEEKVCAPVPDPASLLPVLKVRLENGTVQEISFRQFGGIDCVMALVADSVFLNEPVCDTKLFRSLIDKKRTTKAQILIERAKDNTWVLFEKEKVRLKNVIVRLPAGQNGFNCVMKINYMNGIGQNVQRQFEATDNRNEEFFASFIDPVQQDESGKVSFSISVSSLSECGAPDRLFSETVTGPKLTVDLEDGNRTNRKIVYVSMANDTSLGSFGFDAIVRKKLGNDIHSAIEAAHQRASHFEADKAWSLSAADIVALQPSQAPRVLLAVTGTELRTKPTESFAADPRDVASLAADTLFPVSVTTLTNALRPVVDQSQRVDELTVALIAPFSPLSPIDGVEVCRADVYRSVARELNAVSGGVTVKLEVFPIVGLKDSFVPDLNEIEFLGYRKAKPELSSDMVLCQNTSDNVTVKPFFAQSWRSADDIAARFGVALGDEFGSVLANLISGD